MITLNEIVNGYLKETDEGDDAYARAFSFAIDGYRELMFDVGGKIKTKKLTVLANKTAQLPKDILNWIRIGVLNERGEIATLSQNTDLSLSDACSADRLSQPTVQTFYPFFDDFYFFNWAPFPYVTSPSLGTGSLTNIGDFTIDTANNLILFGFQFRYTEVIIEYLGMPTNEGGDYLVHPFFIQPIRAYIYWAAIRKNKRLSIAERREAKNEYYSQRRIVVARMNPVTIQDINDQRKHTKGAPKA